MSGVVAWLDSLNPAASALVGIVVGVLFLLIWQPWANRTVERFDYSWGGIALALAPVAVLVAAGFAYLAMNP